MSLPDKTVQESIGKRVTRFSLSKLNHETSSLSFIEKNKKSPTKQNLNSNKKENGYNFENEEIKEDLEIQKVLIQPQKNVPNKRGRKSNAELEELKKSEHKEPNILTISQSNKNKKSRGRPKKDSITPIKVNDQPKLKKKKTDIRKKVVDDDETILSSEESIDKNTDDDYTIESDETTDEDEDDGNDQEESEIDSDSDFSDEIYDNKKSKNKKKSIPTDKPSKRLNNQSFQVNRTEKEIDSYDINQKVEKWEYELELENKYFKKPVLPNLSEKALSQFLNKNSNKKSVIYECPFCKKIFTYPLVFKVHLFSCPENKNVPEFILFCVKCDHKGQKKLEMIKHYLDEHEKDINNKQEKLSECKKSQLEVSRYFYINRNEYKYAFAYLNGLIGNKYKRLKFIDKNFEKLSKIKNLSPDYVLNYDKFSLDSDLRFKHVINNENEDEFILKPFQFYNGDEFKLINLINQITAMDWSYRYYDANKKIDSQFLAVSTIPLDDLYKLLDLKQSFSNYAQKYCLQHLFESTNIIYVFKFLDLNSSINVDNKSMRSFGILNKEIGYINCLKWRPDFGASLMNESTEFLGYLLATSSNGNGYIYYINDLTTSESTNSINIFEPKKEIILRPSFLFGQCTSADWSQMNGATQIAIGYSNGSVALYHLNSNTLNDLLSFEKHDHNENKLVIYPIKTFNAHLTFVKTLKWSKINNNILATGSLFSREIKVWDTTNTDKYILDYEIMITDLAFSLHSSDLFMAKEASLKGTNHLSAIDLNHNIYNTEKDESRAHSSLFYTFSSMSSLDQSDFLNKLLVCDYDGNIILSRSNDPKYWTQKHKMMNHSFAQIAKFSVFCIDNEEKDDKSEQNNSTNHINYDINQIKKEKTRRVVEINLERVTQNKQNATKSNNPNQNNPINVDLNSLVKICWNPNLNFNNWYASASLSGFVFMHKLNEIKPI